MSAELFARQCLRRSLLSRLAPSADEELHGALARGKSFNGNTDFEDLLLAWDYGPAEARHDDGSFSAAELDLLRLFDAHLDEHYGEELRNSNGSARWMFTAEQAPPPSWQETVGLAQRTLAQFADFDLEAWRAAGRPSWD